MNDIAPRRHASWILSLTTIAALAFGMSAAAAEPARVGQKIENFSLNDVRGASRSLNDFANSKLVVVAFLGTECPLAKLYGPRLAELAKEFAGRGVTLAIDKVDELGIDACDDLRLAQRFDDVV